MPSLPSHTKKLNYPHPVQKEPTRSVDHIYTHALTRTTTIQYTNISFIIILVAEEEKTHTQTKTEVCIIGHGIINYVSLFFFVITHTHTHTLI